MTTYHAIVLLAGIAWLSTGVYCAGYILGYSDRGREGAMFDLWRRPRCEADGCPERAVLVLTMVDGVTTEHQYCDRHGAEALAAATMRYANAGYVPEGVTTKGSSQ